MFYNKRITKIEDDVRYLMSCINDLERSHCKLKEMFDRVFVLSPGVPDTFKLRKNASH